MSDMVKVAAIFAHHTQLKEALSELRASGFKDISVLVRSEMDRQESGEEVRTYSTATATVPRDHVITDQEVVRLGTGHQRMASVLPSEADLIVRKSENAHTIEHNLKRNFDVSTKDPDALLKDSAIGGVLGAIAGAAALLIPGIGPVFATGTLAAAVGAITAGGAAGMFAGALAGILQDEGLPQERVGFYRKAFHQGKAIIIVEPHGEDEFGRIRLAREILNRHHPDTLDTF